MVSEWTSISLGWKHIHILHKELIKQERHLASCHSSFSLKGACMISKAHTYSYMTKMDPAFRFPSASCLLATTIFWSWKLEPGPHWFSSKHTYWGLLWSLLFVHITPPFPLQTLLAFNQTAPAHILPCNLPNFFTCHGRWMSGASNTSLHCLLGLLPLWRWHLHCFRFWNLNLLPNGCQKNNNPKKKKEGKKKKLQAMFM